MYRIIEGRGTGKTSRLMLFAKENNAIFVCGNPDAMRYKAKAYGIDSVNFISYGDFFNHYNEYSNQKYVVDEVVPANLIDNDTKFLYNTTGRYTEYPRGRKLYNDL